eukprot:g31049.t1
MIEYRSSKVMLQLWRTLVVPLLDYCIQFWSLCYKKDVVQLERIQKKNYKDVARVKGLSYGKKLNRLGLFSLECWRLTGDLIEVYKIMRGMDR